jgi:hypothetical protein
VRLAKAPSRATLFPKEERGIGKVQIVFCATLMGLGAHAENEAVY